MVYRNIYLYNYYINNHINKCTYNFYTMKVLFLNTKKQKCGVYQYGKRLFHILEKTPDVHYIYKDFESYQEYQEIINGEVIYDVFFYNYHSSCEFKPVDCSRGHFTQVQW